MLDTKLENTLSYGPEFLLEKFVNLPATKNAPPVSAEEFRRMYGDLWIPEFPPSDYYDLVRAFRIHWKAKTEVEKNQLPSFIAKLFSGRIRPVTLGNAPMPLRPLMKVNSQAGTVELPIEMLCGILTSPRAARFEPRTLLDYLAVWLWNFRNQGKLAICELKGCSHPYYVKLHPRYRYCSQACGYQARSLRKNRWWRENRGAGAKRRRGKRPARKWDRQAKESRLKGSEKVRS